MNQILLFILVTFGISQGQSSCLNADGNWKVNFAYTRLEDCQEGVYYICEEDGTETRRICESAGEAFNQRTGSCELYSDGVCEIEPVCPTNHIAGPHPNGYACREDCVEMGMCWDNRTSKCLCRNSENCPKESPQRSKCPFRSLTEVTCNPAASLEVYPDVSSCSHFYFCVFGIRYRFECPQGEYFEPDAPSYCDLPVNPSRPCASSFQADRLI